MRQPSEAIIFLDRDGVINELVIDQQSGRPESPYRPRDVALIDGVPEALGLLSRAGFRLALVSNQPAAAKGTCTLQDLAAVHEELVAQLAFAGAPAFDAIEYCYHHPDGVVPDLSQRCSCRKPNPGMLRTAIRRLGGDPSHSWMVGDSDVDISAGRAVKATTVMIDHPLSAHRRSGLSEPDYQADSLASAARIIVDPSEANRP